MSHRLLFLCLLVAACGGTATTTTTTTTTSTSPTTTTPPLTTTTIVPPTTTTTLPSEGEVTIPVATETTSDQWEEAFFIPYGDTPETLGTSLGGDGGGILWGPEYGAQGPDGSWWFLDVGKLRLARFSSTGEYVEEVVIPTDLLVQGQYFQWTHPRVLADGTLLAARLAMETTGFLRLQDGSLDEVELSVEMIPRADDGQNLYAFSFDEDSTLYIVDPEAGTAEPTDWMVSRTGDRYRVSVRGHSMTVELPDAGAIREFTFVAAEIGGPAFVSVEVATGEDGTLHFFLLGFPERDERLQLAAYMAMSPEGEVLAFDPMMNPFTPSDPGTPVRLGVMPGGSTPTYMVIGTDGVRVYSRR